MKRVSLILIIVPLTILLCCTNKKNRIEVDKVFQFLPTKEGTLLASAPFIDERNDGNKIIILNSKGELIGIQPINNSTLFQIIAWRNDTIFVALFDKTIDYIELLNENKVDYLRPVSKYHLKFETGQKYRKSNTWVYHKFDEYKIYQASNRISLLQNGELLGIFEIKEVFFSFDELSIFFPQKEKTIIFHPDTTVSIDQMRQTVFEIFRKSPR